MMYGAPEDMVRDIYLDNVRLHIRAPIPRIAQSVGGNLDLRWTATSLNQAIFKHDIPAIYLRYVEGLHVRDFTLIWAANLPDYFSNALEAENSKDLDLEAAARPGSTVAPVWIH